MTEPDTKTKELLHTTAKSHCDKTFPKTITIRQRDSDNMILIGLKDSGEWQWKDLEKDFKTNKPWCIDAMGRNHGTKQVDILNTREIYDLIIKWIENQKGE